MTAHKELKHKKEHREAEDLCDFFEAAIAPFTKLFIATDDFAKEVTGQWATVVYRDMFQMKVCTKVLIKAYDPKSKLFLVRKLILSALQHPSQTLVVSLKCIGRVGRWG